MLSLADQHIKCGFIAFLCNIRIFSTIKNVFLTVVQEGVSVLPGWGTWADQQKEPHWMKAANQKAQRSVHNDLYLLHHTAA